MGDSTIVIHCRDSRSTIMMMIVLFTIMIVVDMIFENIFVVYRTYFMQSIVWFTEIF